MKCQVCGKQEAEVHLSKVYGGQSHTLHLCSECIAATGLSPAAIRELTEDRSGPPMASEAGPHPPSEAVCPGCGMTAEEFRKRSRLGCALCYEAFFEEVETMLGSMHRGLKHVGKQPRSRRLETELTRLRKALKDSVRRQAFEEAAVLRDKIHELQAQK